jgi:phage terminase large subunit GpA-like protein
MKKTEEPKETEVLLCVNCVATLHPSRRIEVGLEHRKRKNCAHCKKRREVVVCFDMTQPVVPEEETDEDGKMICPHCGETIGYVNYHTVVTEYGTYNPIGDGWCSDDSEGSGDYEYTCPECGDDIDGCIVNGWADR